MSLAEASRQYQVALEWDRRVRFVFEGVLSADDVRDEASAEVERAMAALFSEWNASRPVAGGFTVCPTCRALLLPEDEPEHRRWHEQMSFVARAIAPTPSSAIEGAARG